MSNFARRLRATWLLLALLGVPSLAQDAKFVIGEATTRVALAPCPFKMTDPVKTSCGVVREVLRADLEFENVQVVPDRLVKALSIQDPRTPVVLDWQAVGANLLVTFDAVQQPSDLSVDVRVFNLNADGGIVLNKRYSAPIEPARPDSLRVFAHRAADEILGLFQIASVTRTRLVFVSDRDDPNRKRKELYVADYDGFNVLRATVNTALNIFPNWTPGGRGLVYTSYRSGAPQIFLSWIYEGRPAIANVTKEPANSQAFAPVVSPDGTRIAYSANRDGNFDIMVSQIDGSSVRNLTSSRFADVAPCWSPSGLEIAFTSDRGGTPQIWVMDSEGLGIRRISTIGRHNDGCAWNPSREFAEIAYSSRLEGNTSEIAVVDLVTGQTRQLTTSLGKCEYPAWAPTGRHLVFQCSAGGVDRLHQTDRLGRRFRQIAVGPGSSSQPDWSQVLQPIGPSKSK